MLKEKLENLRQRAPRIHCITNYVSMNDCANILLACGASPIMANEEAEAAQITGICGGLTINIGTLSRSAIPGMLAAGKKANELRRPVVLDPVGAGASDFRTASALRLLEEIHFTAIRGNSSELHALYAAFQMLNTQAAKSSGDYYFSESGILGNQSDTNQIPKTGCAGGVDVRDSDRITEKNLEEQLSFAKDFSRRTKAVVAMTGAIDIVANADRAFLIRNGHPIMSRITGTGCQLSALTAAFLAANQTSCLSVVLHGRDSMNSTDIISAEAYERHDSYVSCEKNLETVAAAVCAMGICGEIAQKRMTRQDGTASCRNYLIDAVYRLKPDELEAKANYEVR